MMDSEDLAMWIQDRILDSDPQATASPPTTAAAVTDFELATGEGVKAKVTVELLS